MAQVEVRIWTDNQKKGIPLVIKGKNFTPLMRAAKFIDDHKTAQLIEQHAKELKKMR